MGNCSDRRFPWPTRSTCEVVFDRVCGMGGLRRVGEGKKVVVEVEEGEVEEAVEETLLLDFSPMQVFWVLSRVRRARSRICGAALAQEMELMLLCVRQPNALRRRIRRARRCRISETVAGGNPYISR
jgi:hypothetical protein